MSNVKRWYFYFVSAISLQAVAWAVIVMLRNRTVDSVAFQAAVIIVGLPIFLLHWRWATRSEDEEEDDHIRAVYLYFMLAAFLVPIITNATGFAGALLRAIAGIRPSAGPYAYGSPMSNGEVMANTAITVGVLGILALYHVRLLREEDLPGSGIPAALRRTFVYFFSAFGLVMFALGLGRVLRWVIVEIGSPSLAPSYWVVANPYAQLINSGAQLLAGLVVWLIFWRRAQQLFSSGNQEEAESVLRKTYLYLIVFISTLTIVSDLTIIGASQLRRLLGLEPSEDTGIVLSTLIVGALLWAYHAYVLREDSQAAAGVEAQAGVRRIYWYLVAGVGLLTLLIGMGGEISVLINAIGRPAGITDALREQLAWFTAALFAGILVWIIPWRKIQNEVSLPEREGISARSAGVRRYYLYGFILLATLTFLGCAVFLVYALLSTLLGTGGGFDIGDLAQAGAYGLMATLVWLYHGMLLRGDNAMLKTAESHFGPAPAIAIIDDVDGRLGIKLQSALESAMPGATFSSIGLTPAAQATFGGKNGHPETAAQPEPDRQPAAAEQPALADVIKSADIIVGPWTVITPFAGEQPLQAGAIAAIAASPAPKVLIPKTGEGWNWSGVAEWKEDSAVDQAVQAVKQVATGKTVKTKKPMTAGRIIFIILTVLFSIPFLFVLVNVILSFTYGF
jgi:hypothetical protein